MQMSQVQDRINTIEQCVDQAVSAMGSVGSDDTPDELRQCVDEMHRQARSARDLARQGSDESQITSSVDGLEELGDKALQACRNAGSSVPQPLQSAVQRAHAEISSLKKQLH